MWEVQETVIFTEFRTRFTEFSTLGPVLLSLVPSLTEFSTCSTDLWTLFDPYPGYTSPLIPAPISQPG